MIIIIIGLASPRLEYFQEKLILISRLKDGFYRGYNINGVYTKNSQTEVIGRLVGSMDLAEIYVLGGDIYLARGHLAPNADFMTHAWQVSFHIHFISL